MYLVIIMSFKKPKIYIFGEKDGQQWMGRPAKPAQEQTCLDKFRHVWTSLDKFRQV